MIAGTLEVQMLANMARLQKDMERAQRMVGGATTAIERMAGRARTALELVGVGVGATAMAAFVRAALMGVDALNDIADATGASIEMLSALEQVASRNGATMDTAGDALIKFNKQLSDAKAGSETEAVLKSIGLSAAELRRLDPAQALQLTAQALARYSDDGAKARIVQELFGKSVKEVGPFLKDLAAQTQLVGKVSTEEAQRIETFNKAIFALKTDAMDLGRSVLITVVQGLYDTKKALEDTNPLVTVLAGSITGLAAAGAFGTVVVGVKALSGALAGLAAVLLANPVVLALLGIGAIAGAGVGIVKAMAATKDGTEAAIASLEEANARSLEAMGRAKSQWAKDNIAQTMAQRRGEIAKLRGELNVMAAAADKVDSSFDSLENRRLSQDRRASAPDAPDPAAAKAAQKAYEALLQPIKERISLQRAEASLGRELTEQEKFTAKVLGDLKDKKIALGSAQGKYVLGLLKESAALDETERRRAARLKQLQAEAAYIQEVEDEQAQAAVDESKRREQVRAGVKDYARGIDETTKRLAIERKMIGASNEQRSVALEQLEVQLELERQLRNLGYDDGMDEGQREEERQKLRAKAAQQMANVEERTRIETDRARAEGISASIEEGLMTGFRKGRSIADVWLQELQAQFAKTVLRPIMSPIVSAGNAAMDDVMKGLMGGLKGLMNVGSTVDSSVLPTGADMDAFYSMSGGGYTGDAARSGGLDGEGGFWAMLHPQETVVDHAKGQSMGGGTVYAPNIAVQVDARADQASVVSGVRRAIHENNKAVFDELRG